MSFFQALFSSIYEEGSCQNLFAVVINECRKGKIPGIPAEEWLYLYEAENGRSLSIIVRVDH